MPKSLLILHRVLVNYFYKVNAGLFTFAFFVLFGLPHSPLAFHYSIITGIVQSQNFLIPVLVCWTFYNVKCADYISKQIFHQEQSFLFCLNCLPRQRLYSYCFYVHLFVFLPVLLYCIPTIVIALSKHAYLPAGEVLLFNLIVLFATPHIYLRAIHQNRLEIKTPRLLSYHLNVRKRYFLFPVYYLLNTRKQMLLVTKIFSLVLLYLFIQLYEPRKYDLRPVQLCILLTSAAHMTIVFECRMFETRYLAFSKSLPITLFQRFSGMLLMYACLLLPEFIILLKGVPSQFALIDYPQLLLLLLVLMCLFHVSLMLDNIVMDEFIKIVFGICATSFFIILYNQGLLLSVAILLLSFALYNAYYHHYEKRYG